MTGIGKKLRLNKERLRRIDKRVAISKAIIVMFAFLISLQFYSILCSYFKNWMLFILIPLVFIITNLLLFIVFLFVIKLILGRDTFLLALGIEPHDHRYNSSLGIFFLIRNIFKLSK